MNEEKAQIADGVASVLNAELDTGDEVNLLLVSALRQYQHLDSISIMIVVVY